jgi:Skp family chaperone for outer membrane proteins
MIEKFNRHYESTGRARRLVQAEDESLQPTKLEIKSRRRKLVSEVKHELGYPDQAFRIEEAELDNLSRKAEIAQAKMFDIKREF